MNATRRRALTLAAAMGSTAALAWWAQPHRGGPGEAAALSLEDIFPEAFATWRIDAVSRDIVRPANRDGRLYGIYDRVLERTYVDANGYRIMLSVAFGAEQSAGMQLHRPEVCYRYGGYQVGAPQPVRLDLAGRSIPATRLQTDLPGRPEPVTYWTVLAGVVARQAGEIRRRRFELALRRQRIDGMLVRVSSVDPDAVRAYARQARFADELVRAIEPADQPRVIGEVRRA